MTVVSMLRTYVNRWHRDPRNFSPNINGRRHDLLAFTLTFLVEQVTLAQLHKLLELSGPAGPNLCEGSSPLKSFPNT
jgi:hypothetical protein